MVRAALNEVVRRVVDERRRMILRPMRKMRGMAAAAASEMRQWARAVDMSVIFRCRDTNDDAVDRRSRRRIRLLGFAVARLGQGAFYKDVR